MIKELAKYGKAYDTPTGLQEDSYYEMMYHLMDYANSKGLTVRQAQKLFTDCADMVLDCNFSSDKSESKLSDIDRLINKLDDIKVRLEDIYRSNNNGIYQVHEDNPQT